MDNDKPEIMMKSDLLGLSSDIVSAYVSHNAVTRSDLSALIASVHGTLRQLNAQPVQASPAQKPAVSVRKSVAPDRIICLQDGKKFKSLRRHLATSHGLTPQQYRD